MKSCMASLVLRNRVFAAIGALATLYAAATENGATSFPSGGDDFLVAAMPPPGFYGIAYGNRYAAHRLAGDSGDVALERFDLRVSALALRFDWVKPASILGADRWGTLVVVPLLDVDLAIEPVPGVNVRGAARGAGDLTIGNGLHWTFAGYEMVNAIDVVAPTGRYDAANVVNLGRNQWVVRANHMGSWLGEAYDVSYRLHCDYNFRNDATGYRSGSTAYLNFAAGWKPGAATTVGLVGYALRQLNGDRLDGGSIGANKREATGLGPGLKHFFPGGAFVTAKYLVETEARNGPRGRQLWLDVGMRF